MRHPSSSVEGGAEDSESHSSESTVLTGQAGDEQDSQGSSSFLSVLDSVGFGQEPTTFFPDCWISYQFLFSAFGSCSSCRADLSLVLFIVMCVSVCVGLCVPQCT